MKRLLLLLMCLSALRLTAQPLIHAAFSVTEGEVFFCMQDEFVLYDLAEGEILRTWNRPDEAIPGLPFDKLDCAVNYGNGKLYFFSGSQYARYDLQTAQVDPGYPKFISENWKGLNGRSFDAALTWPDRSYFFSGNMYWRYNHAADCVDEGYPKPVTNTTWPGLGDLSFDAAFTSGGKSYFIRDDLYYRYDIANDRCDPGYPRRLANLDPLEGTSYVEMGIYEGTIETVEGGPMEQITEVKTHTIDLGAYVMQSPNSVLPDFWAKVDENGNIFLSIQQKNDMVLFRLDRNFRQMAQPLVFSNYWYSDMLPQADGGVVLLLGRSVNNTYLGDYPNTINLIKVSREGRQQFATKIFGGEGHGPGKSWFDGRSQGRLVSNGREFGIYFEVQKNWAERGEDIHNGDAFYVTDMNGRIKEDRTHFWTASHSNTLQVVSGNDGRFFTGTIGDASPFGLQLYDRNNDESHVVWPPKEDYVPYEACNSSNAAGLLRFMADDGQNVIAVLGTTEHPNIGWKTKVDPLFLKVSKSGEVLREVWLEQDPNTDASVISVEPIGNDFLVAWGPGNEYDQDWAAGTFTWCRVDREGRVVGGLHEMEQPFCSGSRLLPLPDGRYVWFEASRNGAGEITLYELTTH